MTLASRQLARLTRDLLGVAGVVRTGGAKIIRDNALTLATEVKRHASGRPGPNAPTGDYRRSIDWRLGSMEAVVGSDKPQGRRLEWGFVGADSLGRYYNQPPYPHWGPAVAIVEPRFIGDFVRLLDRGLR